MLNIMEHRCLLFTSSFYQIGLGILVLLGTVSGQCPTGFYGTGCNIPCDPNCAVCSITDPSDCGCNQNTGYCNGACPIGRYGNFCENNCSINCVDVDCYRSSGYCRKGCRQGWKGIMCNEQCRSGCTYGCDQTEDECVPLYCQHCNGGLINCDHTQQKCTSGCITGWYGNSCDRGCAELTSKTNCLNCVALSGTYICNECDSGWYYNVSSCQRCSTNCISVSEGASCHGDTGSCKYGCTTGWSGTKCETSVCNLDNCLKCYPGNPNRCLTCNTGYYGDDCATSCSTCTNNNCSMDGSCLLGCEPRYYGVKCENRCGYCSNNECPTNGLCPGSCFPTFYGSYCNETCPSSCANSQCDKMSGKCLSCNSGTTGDNCDKPCSNNCYQSQCHIDGVCSKGCVPGLYGQNCNLQCGHCANNVCDSNTGVCPSLCENGYYGIYCNQTCSSNCLDSQCDKFSSKCTNCYTGRYGDYCTSICSTNCSGNSCDQQTGNCTKGCISGWTGSKCESLICAVKQCLQCYSGQGDRCKLCKAGTYGERCDKTCSTTCARGECNMTGSCIYGCDPGYYGESCDFRCGYCFNTTCNFNTGICSSSCVIGYYGDDCNDTCSISCSLRSCDKESGKCTGACAIGLYGEYCNNTCNANCASQTCDKISGNCNDGCITGWSGFKCDYNICTVVRCTRCYSAQNDKCMTCQTGYYGDKCDETCSGNCNQETPNIFLNKTHVVVSEGQIVKRTCSAIGNPTPTVNWYRDNRPYTSSTRTSAMLLLEVASRNDTGTYTCKAEAVVRTGNQSQIFTNLEDIQIYVYYISINKPAPVCSSSESISISCCSVINSSRPLRFHGWTHRIGNTNIRSFNGNLISAYNTSLSIDYCGYYDSGIYTCEASVDINNNNTWQYFNSSIEIIVPAPPVVSSNSVKEKVADNKKTMSVQFYSVPKPVIVEWIKDGEKLTFSNKYQQITSVTNVTLLFYATSVYVRGYESYLSILNPVDKDFGTYIFRVQNSEGIAQLKLQFNKDDTRHENVIGVIVGGVIAFIVIISITTIACVLRRRKNQKSRSGKQAMGKAENPECSTDSSSIEDRSYQDIDIQMYETLDSPCTTPNQYETLSEQSNVD